ncbi:MAG: Hsp20/alpha crystallin family protein [Proteobacteria bacterium]|nr:Hsp20/alpha crystallin family protein [Pseudomonadota bacterium]
MATLPSPFRRTEVPVRQGDGDFLGLWREMDRLFDDFTRSTLGRVPIPTEYGLLQPVVDVSETDRGLELKAELPGIDQKDIDIELSDDMLTLKAEKKIEREEKDEARQYHLSERSYGTFLRRFRLPFEAEASRIEASFDKGVLKIFAPRSAGAQSKTKKIQLRTTH